MRAVAVTSAIAAIGLVWAATPSPADPPPSFVSRNCVACHNSRVKSGELDLQTLASEPIASHREKWERVLQRVERGEMPPKGMPRPGPQDLASFRSGLETEFERLDRDAGPNPGRVTARRLNRYEYNNTIRDLTGLDIHPADDFPADNSGYGFDNNGDVLSISPVLMEKYFVAAEKVAELAIVTNGPLPESHIRIISCGHAPGQHDANCARTVLTGLERRAYRRPPTDAEVTKLLQLVNQAQQSGDSFEQSMRLGLEAVLVSPHFLFRIEQDPAEGQHRLSDYELAARLSYFVWSSMPDDELSGIADRGGLRDPKVLEAQVRRMLVDPKAKALAENFAGQWLETRNLKYHKPDPEKFPAFNRELRDDMLRETEMFFNAVVVEDRSILDFIDAPFTFLNERLAKHYRIDGVTGPEFRRVALNTPQRSGILTQASVLIVSSYQSRTSPVIRGKWVLENILNAPPPPPPPNVPNLDDDKSGGSASLRQQLEKHRANAVCASCHQRMDPLGFGLENYDATGAWRTADGKFPIDAAGTLPDGRSFQSPAELKVILRQDANAFAQCLTEKLMIYALGRGLESYDRQAVQVITKRLAANGYRWSELVLGIVESPPFQMRQKERPAS